MPTTPFPNTWRVVCHQTFFGEESVNVHHLFIPAGQAYDSGVAQLIANEYNTFYAATAGAAAPNRGIQTYRPSFAVLDKVTIYDLRTVPNPPPFEFVYASAGATVGSVMPVDMAAVITLRTDVGTRAGRGRVFVGPWNQNMMEAAAAASVPRFSTAFATDLCDAYQDLHDRLEVVSPTGKVPGVLSLADGVLRPVTSITVDLKPDTQRRRDYDLPVGAAVSRSI